MSTKNYQKSLVFYVRTDAESSYHKPISVNHIGKFVNDCV